MADLNNLKPGTRITSGCLQGTVTNVKWNREDGSLLVMVKVDTLLTEYAEGGSLKISTRRQVWVPIGDIVI